MSVAALSVGKVHIEGWGESVRQKRGGVKNIIDVPMIEIMAKLLNKFTADKRILVSINLVMVIFAIVVEATSGKFPYLILSIIAIMETILLAWAGSLRRKSRAHIEKGLPDALDVIARVYRVHTDLKVAFAEVATNSDNAEIKRLFTEVVKLARFGFSLEEALNAVAEKIKSDDFDFVVTTVTLNTPTGGNLSAMLENTAKVLRDRKEAEDEIKNLMFQSKFSSMAVSVLVPLIAAGLLIGDKNSREVLLFTPNGRLLFVIAMIWWLIGVIIVKKSTKIQI